MCPLFSVSTGTKSIKIDQQMPKLQSKTKLHDFYVSPCIYEIYNITHIGVQVRRPVLCRRCSLEAAVKLIGPWLAFRLVWKPFVRHVYRTLVKTYGYRACDATATTHWITLCCGVVALLVSMHLNGQLYWACTWLVSPIKSNQIKSNP